MKTEEEELKEIINMFSFEREFSLEVIFPKGKDYSYHCGRCNIDFLWFPPENEEDRILSQNSLCAECSTKVAEEISLYGERLS